MASPSNDGSLADIAFASIEESIVNRVFAPGAMISENQLSEELGMGRTPIREALQRLRHIGFVDVHPRRGVQVSGVDIMQQLNLLEVRAPLEALMVSCAASRRTSRERDELEGLSLEMKKAAKTGDSASYFRGNKLIHEAEVRAAHNPVLSHTMQGIHAQSRRFWYTYVEQTRTFTEGAERHGAVVDSIIRSDAEKGRKAVGELMKFLEALTRDVIERR